MHLKLSDLRSDFKLTLGYLNLALNNMALEVYKKDCGSERFIHVFAQLETLNGFQLI